jgi:hypothetical protein
MLSTTDLNFTHDLPDTWVFEHYTALPEMLIGQSVKIRSAFNANDKVPSMIIYLDDRDLKYKFKDFSSGLFGDCINLVQYLYNLTYTEAIKKIQSDYAGVPDAKKRQIVKHDRYKVTDYQIRLWNNEDVKYWSQYKLGSDILEKYEVYPLEYYVMTKKEIDGTLRSFRKTQQYTYGYFNSSGDLIKIYQPKLLEKKFIKVKHYLQGLDQLTYSTKYLLITSSLKDLMCFMRLGIGNIESVAPDSENTIIEAKVMEEFLSKYTKVLVLFDNDEPGKKSAVKYKELYGVDSINLDLSKDLSDSVKDYSIKKVKEELYKLVKSKL